MKVHKEEAQHYHDDEVDYHKSHTVVSGHVDPNDPAHDIDAKKTVTWLVVWTVALFLGIWLMVQLFYFMVRGERERKVARPVSTELQQLRQREEIELAGLDDYISIEDAMKELLKK